MDIGAKTHYGRTRLPYELFRQGKLGSVYFYRGPGSGRAPAREFFDGLEERWTTKFDGSFRALTILGNKYVNSYRFKPLSGPGKPLWEFKEFDHRIYCGREEYENGSVRAILLSGWTKDKGGRGKEEKEQIKVAVTLYNQVIAEGFKRP